MSGYAHENRGERCDRCGQLLFGRRRRRRDTPAYCSRVCSNRAQAERRTPRPVCTITGRAVAVAARLEDLSWMLDTGESLLMCCHRLGVTPHTLARWLSRHQQHDLARLFYGLDKQHQAAA